MRYLVLGLLVCLLLLSPVNARDDSVWCRDVEIATPPITNRIVFVLDVSGSMRGMPIAVASTKVLEIMGDAKDEAFVKIYVFNDTCWSLGSGWWKLPDQTLIEKIAEKEFLDLSAEGNTDIAGALATAMSENTEPDISFVLLTDGEPSGDSDAHLAEVDRAQVYRITAGHGSAVIHVCGLREFPDHSSHAPAVAFMKELARSNGGSCIVMRPRKVH